MLPETILPSPLTACPSLSMDPSAWVMREGFPFTQTVATRPPPPSSSQPASVVPSAEIWVGRPFAGEPSGAVPAEGRIFVPRSGLQRKPL